MEPINKIEFTVDDLISLQNIPNLYDVIKICFIYGSDDAFHALCSSISFGKDLSSPNKRIKYDARCEFYNKLINHIYPNIKNNINLKNLSYLEFGSSLQMLSDRWKTQYSYDELVSLAFIVDLQENHEITYDGFINFVLEIEKIFRNNVSNPKEYLDAFYDMRRENLYKLVLNAIPNIELRNKLAFLAFSSYQFNIQPLALLFELNTMNPESVIGFIIELNDLINRNSLKLTSTSIRISKEEDEIGNNIILQDMMPTETIQEDIIPITNTIDILPNNPNNDINIKTINNANINNKNAAIHQLTTETFISSKEDDGAIQQNDQVNINQSQKDTLLDAIKSFQNKAEQIQLYLQENKDNDNAIKSSENIKLLLYTMENELLQLKNILNNNSNNKSIHLESIPMNNISKRILKEDNIKVVDSISINTIDKKSKSLTIDTKDLLYSKQSSPLNFMEINKLSSIKKQMKIQNNNHHINNSNYSNNSNNNMSSPKMFSFNSSMNINTNHHIKSLNFNETNSISTPSIILSPSTSSSIYRNTIQNKNINLNIFKSPQKNQSNGKQNIFFNEKWIPIQINEKIDKKVKNHPNERFQTVEDLIIAKKVNQVFYKLS